VEPTSDSGTYIVVFRRKRFLIVRSCIKVQHRAMSQAASVRRRDRHVVGRARFAARARGAPPAELHHQREQRWQASGAVPAGDGVGPQHLAMMQRQGRVLFPPPLNLKCVGASTTCHRACCQHNKRWAGAPGALPAPTLRMPYLHLGSRPLEPRCRTQT
jgi:hypothetical protein